MKKLSIILVIISIIFIKIDELNAQNKNLTGAATAIVNGIYLSSNPATENGVFYYVKQGTPTIYLYRWNNISWEIGTVLGTPLLSNLYYTSTPPNDVPDGIVFGWAGDLGVLPGPTIVDTPLPVELSYFIVDETRQGVLCNWTTESEIENLGFLLERKTENTSWTEIASYKTDNTLMGQGTTSAPTDYEYLDKLVEPNSTYEYRLADVDYEGVVTYHSVRTVTVETAPLPSKIVEFTVLSAYPNPFNPSTTITYGIDNDIKVTIYIYDIRGMLINTLVSREKTKGWHSVIWNGTDRNNEQAPAGIYLSKIIAGNEVKTTKLMLLK